MSEIGLPFDRKALAMLGDRAKLILHEIPEVRGIVIVVDYTGNLNQTASSGAWFTKTGGYEETEELLGGIVQNIRMIAKQTEMLVTHAQKLVTRVGELHLKDLDNQRQASEVVPHVEATETTIGSDGQ